MKLTREQIDAQLAEVEMMMQDPKLKEQDMVYRINKSLPSQMIHGFGNTAGNFIGSSANVLSGGAIPYEPIKTGEGMAYDVTSLATEIAPYLIPQAAIGRIGTAGAIGGLTNRENPNAGAAEGALWGFAGEALGPAVKGAGSLVKNKIIEPLSLDKFSKDISEMIKKNYEVAQEKAWGAVGPVLNKFGKEPLAEVGVYGETRDLGSMAFNEFHKANKKMFTADEVKLQQLFEKDPTIENAQKLISKIGVDERRIAHSMDPAKEEKMQVYREAKNLLRDGVKGKMDKLSPGFSQQYDMANKSFAQNVGPYLGGGPVTSAAAGNVERAPDIYSNIMEQSKSNIKGYPGIGAEHELLKELTPMLEKKLGFSQMVPQGAREITPVLGTPLSREYIYSTLNKRHDQINPLLRALIQSQNIPGAPK